MGRRKVYEEVLELRCHFPTTNVALSMPNGFQLMLQEDSSVRLAAMNARNLQQIVSQMTQLEKMEVMHWLVNDPSVQARLSR